MIARLAGIAAVAGWAAATTAAAAENVVPYAVVGDAIPAPLAGLNGDAARGRAVVANRSVGLCVLCHPGPFPEEPMQGTVGPDLSGAGSRWSEGQLRLRVVEARRLNPDSIMPSFHRVEGLERVLAAWRGKPLLTAQQVEDAVAFLATLKE
ncbi:MAG: sulfur oxidation c-type cytochrome SoxX [Alphaproteobacteria bacterium]|nr:sulfur oxidation c-type cytochrome SoxX [Alphaproteobacteria bacterium]